MRGLIIFKIACVISICLTILTLISTDQEWKLQIFFERRHLAEGVDAKLLDDANRVKDIHDVTAKPFNQTELMKKFFEMKSERINPHDYRFIISNKHMCDGIDPFLVMLCLSKYSDITTRDVIRQTWASVVTSRKWPMSNNIFTNIKLVFVLGCPDKAGISIVNEIKAHNDIIMADFLDSYDNLTTKVLMGLKWANMYCPKARFVLKVDQDTFVHVPNLISYLQNLTLTKSGLVAGRVNYASEVFRTGRWNLTWDQFPFDFFPPYLSGNTYIVSGNVLSRIIWIAEHMPYLKLEDVFFTGIVRRIVKTEIHNRPGFTFFNESSPRVCGFHNPYRISATGTDDELKVRLWEALHVDMENCYLPPPRRASLRGR